ncbi:MAG: BON domain-containing protein [Bdellovibrio bacteriovorus]
MPLTSPNPARCRLTRIRAFSAILACALLLNGCAALVVGGAAVGTAAVIHDRRDYTDIIKDQEIEISATRALAKDSLVSGSRISATSYNRKVLLTGQARSPEVAARATELVSAIPKVELVIDEVVVGPNVSFTQQSQDTWITSQAKLALAKVKSPDFDPTRVKVVTEDSVVFLMGLVSPEEGDAAAEQVRFVPGVNRVVKLFEYPTSQP